MIRRWVGLIGAVAACGAPASLVQAAATPSKPTEAKASSACVYITQLQNSHPLGDRAVIYRVDVSDFYELDFAQRCEELNTPEPIVIMTPVTGEGQICHAIDVDIKVREQGPGSIGESCIPSHWRRLTPAEVAAIPKKDLP